MDMESSILIVDDEPMILSGITRALRLICNFQGRIMTITNGRDAVDEAGRRFFNICFLDIKLPDMNGLEVMKEINSISAETDIVVMSACTLSGDMQKAIEQNASSFIAKPFVIDEIEWFTKYVYQGERNVYMEGKDDIMWKREFRRKKIARETGYSLDNTGPAEVNGRMVDISYGGLGMFACNPLERGQVVRLHRGTAHKRGVVRWSTGDGAWNRVGIKFTDNTIGKDL